MNIDFTGPFKFIAGESSVFHSACANNTGVYLWTIKQADDQGHLIHYVGETQNLAKRQKEHLTQILGLNYGIFDSEKAQNGISELLWKGLWREKSDNGPGLQIESYKRLNEEVIKYISSINIFFAEVGTDANMRKHIEG